MANKSQAAVEKVERLLGQYQAARALIVKHGERQLAAMNRLDAIAADLEMFAQHRAVDDDLREKVSAALAGEEAMGAADIEAAESVENQILA